MEKKMKKTLIKGLCATSLLVISNTYVPHIFAEDNIMMSNTEQTITSTWNAAPISFDSKTGTLSVESGEISIPGNINDFENTHLDSDNKILASSVKKIKFKGHVFAPVDSSNLFSGQKFPNLESIEGNLDTSRVTDMSLMFSGSEATSLDISNWDTSNVTNMSLMFANSYNLSNWQVETKKFVDTLNLSNWNTSNVTNMSHMFSSSLVKNLFVDNWNTANVTDMDGLFQNTDLTTLDLSNWDTRKASTYSIFQHMDYLDTLVLGEYSIFSNGNAQLPDTQTNSNLAYTGKWIRTVPAAPESSYASSTYFMKAYNGQTPGTYTREVAPTMGGSVTIQYLDTEGNVLSTSITKNGVLNDSYSTEKLTIQGYTLKEVKGDENGKFTEAAKQVQYIYKKNDESSPKKSSVLVKYSDEQNHILAPSQSLTGLIGEEYITEKLTLSGYDLKEIKGAASGKFTEGLQTITYIYQEKDSANLQELTGSNYTMTLGDKKPTIDNFNSTAKNTNGELIPVTVDFTNVDFTNPGIYEVRLTSKDTQTKTVYLRILEKEQTKIPVFRVYNANNGDHLYTDNRDEYQWLVDLGWKDESIAFNSVEKNYSQAIPVYRTYNPNSGEHFYTTNIDEYTDVANSGWQKEGIAFYTVPQKNGYPIYRVFNPNATGPGSHLFTNNKQEATNLIQLGWKQEGIAFYGLKE